MTPSETPVCTCGEGTWSCYCPKIQAAARYRPRCGEIPQCCAGQELPWPLVDHLEPTALPISLKALQQELLQSLRAVGVQACLTHFHGCKWEARSRVGGATLAFEEQSLPGAALKPRSSEELHRTVTAPSAAADDEAASPTASAHCRAWM